MRSERVYKKIICSIARGVVEGHGTLRRCVEPWKEEL